MHCRRGRCNGIAAGRTADMRFLESAALPYRGRLNTDYIAAGDGPASARGKNMATSRRSTVNYRSACRPGDLALGTAPRPTLPTAYTSVLRAPTSRCQLRILQLWFTHQTNEQSNALWFHFRQLDCHSSRHVTYNPFTRAPCVFLDPDKRPQWPRTSSCSYYVAAI